MNTLVRFSLVISLLAVAGCSSSESSWTPKSNNGSKSKTEEGKTPAKTTPRKHVATVTPLTVKLGTPGQVADFTLTERSGKTVTRADLIGKPWVACFIFTNCSGFCGHVTKSMYELQAWMRKNAIDDVKIVTFTVEPERDTPEVLRVYAENFSADKNRWWFLTGDKKTIFGLIRGSFDEVVRDAVGQERAPGYEVIHTDAVALVDANGKVVGKFRARDPVSMALLRKRLKAWHTTGKFRLPVAAPRPKRAEGE